MARFWQQFFQQRNVKQHGYDEKGEGKMTADLIQLHHTEQTLPVLMAELAQFRAEKDGWSRAMQATVAQLNEAYRKIEQAEKRIGFLEAAATTDELTGLANRRGFYEAFMGEVDRCGRGQSAGGLLVMIDLDNFKAINDTYGHAAGDAALRLVAKNLKAEVRAMDMAARLGGDEFVLLLSNANKRQAAARAQDLGWRLGHLVLVWRGEEIPVRASLGLKDFGPGERPDWIFDAADKALYAQKRARRAQNADRAYNRTHAPALVQEGVPHL